MTLCRDWTLVKYLPEERLAKPLVCRSWGCDYCAPERRSRLMAQAAGGEPTRFLTLTVNPHIGNDPADRLGLLAAAWRNTVKRLRRRFPGKPIEYLAVVEETKQGEPHLHILLRSPYIAQKFISDCMAEMIQSPIVDIRRIKGMKEVVRYVAKYITKAPAQFGKAKRYWASQGYEVKNEEQQKREREPIVKWEVVREDIYRIMLAWSHECWVPRPTVKETRSFFYSTYLANGEYLENW